MGLKELLGRNISISKKLHDKYQELKDYSIFKNQMDDSTRDYKYIYMICLSLGYWYKKRQTVKDPYPILNTSSFSDKDVWTMAAIAYEDSKDLCILSNAKEIKRIASEYAEAGYYILMDLMSKYDTGDNLVEKIEDIAREGLDLKGNPNKF